MTAWGSYISGLPGGPKPGGPRLAEGDFIYGSASNVGSGMDPVVGDTIWAGGGRYPWGWTPGPLTVVSSSANDVAFTGSGAQGVQVLGLDADGKEISENISLNGTTPVSGLLDFHRVNLSQVTFVGSSQYNEGEITITNGVDTVSIIRAGMARSLAAVYTIPRTWIHGAIVPRAWSQVADKRSASIVTLFRARVPGIAWQSYGALVATSGGGLTQFDVAMAGTVLPGTDLEFTLLDSDVTSVNVAAGFDLIKVE